MNVPFFKVEIAMVILGNEYLPASNAPSPSGWAADDDRIFLRLAIRVASLDASVKFYAANFGFQLQTPLLDAPGTQRAFMSPAPGAAFGLELIEDAAVPAPDPGDWFSHFTLIVPSTADVVAGLRAAGRGALVEEAVAAVIPLRSSSSEGGQSSQDVVGVVRDLDGYRWRLTEVKRSAVGPQRLCAVALRVARLEPAVAWAAAALGTTAQLMYEASRPPEYKVALIGFGEELITPQLELRQTEEPLTRRGNGLVRLVVATEDLDATEAALEEAGEPCEREEIRGVAAPGATQAAVTVVTPDGLKVAFVQDEG